MNTHDTSSKRRLRAAFRYGGWAWLFLAAFFSELALSQSVEFNPTTVSLEDILATPITDRSCHNYCVVGGCVWLRCTAFYCTIEYSTRVRHYVPDLVVSVYDYPGDNPWEDAADLYGNVEESATQSLVSLFHGVEAGGGHRVEGGSSHVDQSLRFKEATAIGHPMASFGDYFSSGGYFCPSEAESMVPYFSSGFDALTWRLGTPEMLYFTYLLPGRRVVGEGGFFQQWGPVFPRTGFILQKDDAKAAAVVAQRVGNIVTQTSQPHIYQALNGNNYSRTWLPGELIENDRDTGVWQMVAPYQDTQCYVFGENDLQGESWSTGRQSDDNRYVFNLWRPYECCEQQGAFLFSFDIPPVCVP